MPAANASLNIDWPDFLARYWQRNPLLLPQVLPDFVAPLDANELAGLALEQQVESRLVEFDGEHWALQHGPFAEKDFQRSTAWTLLVQAVDQLVPEVSELRQLFSAIPSWRMDDIMISYAVDGGSVGPHFDNYDVFLLQGEGERLWRTGQRCDENTPLIAHDDLRILQEFNCVEEYLLGPGDMLYLPPGVAHWGIAQGPCTTFSIGFRAPRMSDMLSRSIDALLEQSATDKFYTDVASASAQLPGEIRTEDRQRVKMQLRDALEHFSADEWFGELVTEPRYDDMPDTDAIESMRRILCSSPKCIVVSSGARLAWQASSSNRLDVFANGVHHTADRSIQPTLLLLCADKPLAGKELHEALQNPQTMELLHWLLDYGCIDVE